MINIDFGVIPNFNNYADRIGNVEPVLTNISVFTKNSLEKAIERGQDLGGTKLTPNRPSTIANKKFFGKNLGVLRRDDTLLRSFIYSVNSNKAEIGTNLFYARWVILGTKGPYQIRPKKAPKLRFYSDMGWQSRDEVTHPGLPPRNIFNGYESVIGNYAVSAYKDWIIGDAFFR